MYLIVKSNVHVLHALYSDLYSQRVGRVVEWVLRVSAHARVVGVARRRGPEWAEVQAVEDDAEVNCRHVVVARSVARVVVRSVALQPERAVRPTPGHRPPRVC